MLRSACVTLAALLPRTAAYCLPNQPCWPSTEEWQALSDSLSRGQALWSFASSSFEVCYEQGTDAIGLLESGHGVCMQDLYCLHEACTEGQTDNLPAYSAAVANVHDIQAVLAFANNHNISVSVKTSGHSYSGSSTMKGSLLIWMAKFQKYGTVSSHTDSCGTTTDHILKIGGGQVWGEAYNAVLEAGGRDIVGGGGLTVSAAGGWLTGGGLSALSRAYGYGIDNVLELEVVLANGTEMIVDSCSHPDLFWALRGGGGGSFGVVTAAHYRTHDPSPIVAMSMSIEGINFFTWSSRYPVIASWIDLWTDLSPKLDRRWTGGYWTTFGISVLYFRGSESDARSSFIDILYEWRDGLANSGGSFVTITVQAYPGGYLESRRAMCAGSVAASSPACVRFGMTTDETGNNGINIHSRIIPREWVEADGGTTAKETLRWMAINAPGNFNYFLGGAVTDVPPDATAVHPSVRGALWNMQVTSEEAIEKLREAIPDAGVCFNHAAKNEPNWDEAAWGSNLPRLQAIKAEYDPENRFNCFHCVGYESLGADDLTPAECSSSSQYNCFEEEATSGKSFCK